MLASLTLALSVCLALSINVTKERTIRENGIHSCWCLQRHCSAKQSMAKVLLMISEIIQGLRIHNSLIWTVTVLLLCTIIMWHWLIFSAWLQIYNWGNNIFMSISFSLILMPDIIDWLKNDWLDIFQYDFSFIHRCGFLTYSEVFPFFPLRIICLAFMTLRIRLLYISSLHLSPCLASGLDLLQRSVWVQL